MGRRDYRKLKSEDLLATIDQLTRREKKVQSVIQSSFEETQQAWRELPTDLYDELTQQGRAVVARYQDEAQDQFRREIRRVRTELESRESEKRRRGDG